MQALGGGFGGLAALGPWPKVFGHQASQATGHTGRGVVEARVGGGKSKALQQQPAPVNTEDLRFQKS